MQPTASSICAILARYTQRAALIAKHMQLAHIKLLLHMQQVNRTPLCIYTCFPDVSQARRQMKHRCDARALSTGPSMPGMADSLSKCSNAIKAVPFKYLMLKLQPETEPTHTHAQKCAERSPQQVSTSLYNTDARGETAPSCSVLRSRAIRSYRAAR